MKEQAEWRQSNKIIVSRAYVEGRGSRHKIYQIFEILIAGYVLWLILIQAKILFFQFLGILNESDFLIAA